MEIGKQVSAPIELPHLVPEEQPIPITLPVPDESPIPIQLPEKVETWTHT
jgi:hypothetical protein